MLVTKWCSGRRFACASFLLVIFPPEAYGHIPVFGLGSIFSCRFLLGEESKEITFVSDPLKALSFLFF